MKIQSQSGTLRKMITHAEQPVRYVLPLGASGGARDAESTCTDVPMNELLGCRLKLQFSGAIYCIACGRKTPKSFNQGYCYPCFRDLAACDQCIVKPQLCHFHKGTCRQPQWGQQHCMQPHIVYLANSSALKVGITRAVNVPTRWMDQGAVQARPLVHVQNRLHSGVVEVEIKKYLSDTTNWRKMLQGEPPPLDLETEAARVLQTGQDGLNKLVRQLGDDALCIATSVKTSIFQYPVQQYPRTVRSLSPSKTPHIEGVLQGIKGQYLILDCGVFNVRAHGGYEVRLDVG